MRNLNECRAEVFRRSEKRIKESRRRRNRVLMACIPLTLCVTLLGVFLFPQATPESPANSGGTDAAMGELVGDRAESLSCSVASITVTGSDFSQTYTNTSDVLLITELLYICSVEDSETNSYVGNEILAEGKEQTEDTNDVSASIADSANMGYTITLVMYDGEKTEYYLAGVALTNLTTNQTQILTQEQANEWIDLLGIPQQ